MTEKDAGMDYTMVAAPADAWRVYDKAAPVPGYYQFDWLSARHPDLYHRFALTSVGLMEELVRIVDLAGLDVVDVGAGTGRSTIAAARTARHVDAVDAYHAVVEFGRNAVREAGLTNVTYHLGDRSRLPFPDASRDVVICVWAELDHREAARVLKDGGILAHLGPATGSEAGELSAVLTSNSQVRTTASSSTWNLAPNLIRGEVVTPKLFDPALPAEDTDIPKDDWGGAALAGPLHRHDFSYVADYGSVDEALAINGRLLGPAAAAYLAERRQATVAWRLRIHYARIAKNRA